MYGIFTDMCHKDQLNVGKYTIHGWYGICFCFLVLQKTVFVLTCFQCCTTYASMWRFKRALWKFLPRRSMKFCRFKMATLLKWFKNKRQDVAFVSDQEKALLRLSYINKFNSPPQEVRYQYLSSNMFWLDFQTNQWKSYDFVYLAELHFGDCWRGLNRLGWITLREPQHTPVSHTPVMGLTNHSC